MLLPMSLTGTLGPESATFLSWIAEGRFGQISVIVYLFNSFSILFSIVLYSVIIIDFADILDRRKSNMHPLVAVCRRASHARKDSNRFGCSIC